MENVTTTSANVSSVPLGNHTEFSVVQVVTLSLLGFMSIDFLLHSLVIFYMIICLSCRKNSSLCFGLFITTIFIVVRVIVGFLLLTIFQGYFPWIKYMISLVPPRVMEALYYIGITGLLLGIVPPILTGLALLFSGDLARSKSRAKPKAASSKSNGFSLNMELGNHPMVAILIPVYNEEEDVLIRSVDSVIESVYPQDRKHLFVSFDDAKRGSLFNSLIKHLCERSSDFKDEYEQQKMKSSSFQYEEEPVTISATVDGMRVTVSTFVHAGKRLTQSQTYNLIRDTYAGMAANAYVLSMDSDVYLDHDCIQDLIDYSTKQGNILGLTGLITCAQPEGLNILEQLQNADRIEKETMDRTLETALGANSCLHGMITIVPLSALMKVAPTYFGHDVASMSTIDFHQYQLGEDRYLTVLLMEESRKWGQVSFTCKAKCRTVFPSTLMQLLKQRRRWFLATLVNDMNLLCSPNIWSKYALLQSVKAYQYLSRGFTIVTWAMVVLQLMSNDSLSVRAYVAISAPAAFILVRMALAIIASVRLREYKTACFVPLTVIYFQLWEEMVMVFSLFTWRTRTWGGPRVEKEKELEEEERKAKAGFRA